MSSYITYPDTENRFHDTGAITMAKGLQWMNADFNFLPGLAAYWQFDNSTFVDGGPNHYHLTRTGSVPLVAGKIGNAANFTGNAANFLSNSNLIVPTDAAWSLSAWVKMHSLTSDSHLFGNAVSGAFNGWRLMFVSGEQAFALSSFDSGASGEERCVSATDITAETWYHVVATVDATQFGRIYVNGVVTEDAHLFFSNPSQPFRVGNDNDAAAPANAAIDEIALWSGRVLSQSEVFALFNGGSGRTVI
jgi:hypothetical protein